MSYGSYETFQIICILILNVYVTDCQNSTCYHTSDSTSELLLGSTDFVIHEKLLKLCPENTSKLLVTSHGVPALRRLSPGFLRSSILPRLKELYINVIHLEIPKAGFLNNISSSLVTLSISNCGIQYLPSYGMFFGLSNLKTLDLSLNNLSRLPVDTFQYSNSLTTVNLSYNFLKILPSVPHPISVIVSNNPITCSCVNARLSNNGRFKGLPPCDPWPSPCEPRLDTVLYVGPSGSNVSLFNDNSSVSVLAGQQLSFVCSVNSDLPYELFWVSPIGVVSLSTIDVEVTTYALSYVVQPILAPTVLHLIQVSETTNALNIKNTRGYLSGNWLCIAHSPELTSRSSSVNIRVVSSLYHAQIYYISLCYGYGGMILLLLVGVIGGTIRYCSETHCLRRPQPSCAFKGKTYVGVIPVPEVEILQKSKSTDKNLDIPLRNPAFKYSRYFGPNTRWKCNLCKTIHFVEEIHEIEEANLLIAAGNVPVGRITPDGEIIVINLSDPNMEPSTLNILQPISDRYNLDSTETHLPLMDALSLTPDEPNFGFNRSPQICKYDVCVRSGSCVIRVRLDVDYSYSDCMGSVTSLNNASCVSCLPRPGSADVKLIVSNEKLAQEYREALASLAKAVENPDPAHFREKLEDFRSRLCRDVGHGVKVLRGEFQDLRAKSAKSVASLRNQSSVAAQRMRAGISYGVEQMKDSMRSVAELCGASGTIGQTISVVSVYVDQKDQIKKEKHISDFVF
ncbi:leucine-rich repeat and fibronectin type-III domain-containing 5-like [Schistosoma japonicum]|uniref:Leucine-rich repeat and fibronectin type-III domain-containing 5-like n=1 Tax=Schistosoma japonicum TaxID=6182 RepID=A0A4Z2DTA3_SCHJA|nr:leucine-rich repeat and fibronectin type-III domain-containing 5-like [Schistosoma japonicum]